MYISRFSVDFQATFILDMKISLPCCTGNVLINWTQFKNQEDPAAKWQTKQFQTFSNYHVHSDKEIMTQKEQNRSDVLQERYIWKFIALKRRRKSWKIRQQNENVKCYSITLETLIYNVYIIHNFTKPLSSFISGNLEDIFGRFDIEI